MRKQHFIFVPKFRKDHKSVYFTSGLDIPSVSELNLNASTWNYETYGDTEYGTFDKSSGIPLKPTKYESYEFLDLGDHEEDWIPVYVLLGFKTLPGKYHIESFKFGNIEIMVTHTTNEVGEPFLKLQGSTTRKVLNLIIQSLKDLKDWILDNKLDDKIMSLDSNFGD